MGGYRSKKRLGQNFLKSEKVIGQIVALIDAGPNDTVIEIGPGRGALTEPLAESGARTVAVEFDRDLAPRLRRELAHYDNLSVIQEDILDFEPGAYGLGSFILAGNLPYNITSPVLEWTVVHRQLIRRAVLMMQREVAARVAGSPGTKDWSPLSIFTQIHFDVDVAFTVPPGAFEPPPQVTSAVAVLRPHATSPPARPGAFEQVVRQSFARRRKLLVNNLGDMVQVSLSGLREVLADLGFPPDIRAEQMSTEDFMRLTDHLVENQLI